MHTLVTELVADLRARGVELRTGTAATAVARTQHGWEVTAGEGGYRADVLVVALDGPSAVRLLRAAVPALAKHEPGPGPVVKLVTLVVDFPLGPASAWHGDTGGPADGRNPREGDSPMPTAKWDWWLNQPDAAERCGSPTGAATGAGPFGGCRARAGIGVGCGTA